MCVCGGEARTTGALATKLSQKLDFLAHIWSPRATRTTGHLYICGTVGACCTHTHTQTPYIYNINKQKKPYRLFSIYVKQYNNANSATHKKTTTRLYARISRILWFMALWARAVAGHANMRARVEERARASCELFILS